MRLVGRGAGQVVTGTRLPSIHGQQPLAPSPISNLLSLGTKAPSGQISSGQEMFPEVLLWPIVCVGAGNETGHSHSPCPQFASCPQWKMATQAVLTHLKDAVHITFALPYLLYIWLGRAHHTLVWVENSKGADICTVKALPVLFRYLGMSCLT